MRSCFRVVPHKLGCLELCNTNSLEYEMFENAVHGTCTNSLLSRLYLRGNCKGALCFWRKVWKCQVVSGYLSCPWLSRVGLMIQTCVISQPFGADNHDYQLSWDDCVCVPINCWNILFNKFVIMSNILSFRSPVESMKSVQESLRSVKGLLVNGKEAEIMRTPPASVRT